MFPVGLFFDFTNINRLLFQRWNGGGAPDGSANWVTVINLDATYGAIAKNPNNGKVQFYVDVATIPGRYWRICPADGASIISGDPDTQMRVGTFLLLSARTDWAGPLQVGYAEGPYRAGSRNEGDSGSAAPFILGNYGAQFTLSNPVNRTSTQKAQALEMFRYAPLLFLWARQSGTNEAYICSQLGQSFIRHDSQAHFAFNATFREAV